LEEGRNLVSVTTAKHKGQCRQHIEPQTAFSPTCLRFLCTSCGLRACSSNRYHSILLDSMHFVQANCLDLV
jgi:hypothetical protein